MPDFQHHMCERCWIEDGISWEDHPGPDDINYHTMAFIEKPKDICNDALTYDCCFCGSMTIWGALVYLKESHLEYCNH